MNARKRIAVIGTGIAGMVAAYRLHRDHDITVFEANDYIGGHTHTHDIELDGRRHAVDSGFIVFNDWTYPNFIKLLDHTGQLMINVQLVAETDDARSALQQFAETSSVPTCTSVPEAVAAFS